MSSTLPLCSAGALRNAPALTSFVKPITACKNSCCCPLKWFCFVHCRFYLHLQMGWTSCTSTMRPRHRRNTTTARASAVRGKTTLSPRECHLSLKLIPQNPPWVENLLNVIYHWSSQDLVNMKCASPGGWVNVALSGVLILHLPEAVHKTHHHPEFTSHVTYESLQCCFVHSNCA